jgi:signal transduction histidine kinase
MMRQQRQFMMDASHELRTPLSIVTGAAEVALAQSDRTSAEYREALAIVTDEGRRLRRLVEDMFTLTRADAGQQIVECARVYLDEVITETVRAADVLAAANGVEIRLTAEADQIYFGDELMLRRLVLNLLDNAIQHSPRGSYVEIALEHGDNMYVIRVVDHGSGISLSEQSLIFNRFYRADQTRVRYDDATRGAGLGLAIARSIAEAHGGRLDLQHSGLDGSTFVVTLPIRQHDRL